MSETWDEFLGRKRAGMSLKLAVAGLGPYVPKRSEAACLMERVWRFNWELRQSLNEANSKGKTDDHDPIKAN